MKKVGGHPIISRKPILSTSLFIHSWLNRRHHLKTITRTNIPKGVSGIYQIQSKRNGKIYIGSAVNLKERKCLHFWDLKNKKHTNGRLQNHYNKYGKVDLQFFILEFCEKERLIEREQFYINALKPEFNICQIAGSSLGTTHSEKTKQKMSIAQVGKHHTEETKQKMSKSRTGRHHTEETKQKMSKAKIGKYDGENNPNFGKHLPCSEETKQKLRGRVPWNKGLKKEFK